MQRALNVENQEKQHLKLTFKAQSDITTTRYKMTLLTYAESIHERLLPYSELRWRVDQLTIQSGVYSILRN